MDKRSTSQYSLSDKLANGVIRISSTVGFQIHDLAIESLLTPLLGSSVSILRIDNLHRGVTPCL